MSHGADDPAGDDHGVDAMGGMVPPVPGTSPTPPAAGQHGGHGADDTTPEAGGHHHGGRVGGAPGADDPAGDDNGVDAPAA